MSENTQEVKRTLGLIDATSLVAGSMIGSGIFIVSTYMARDIGASGWLLALWLLTGLITVFAALSYGELAGMMPNAGGQYVYLQRAYGKVTSFLYGWTVFTVIQTGVIAAVAMAFVKYTAVFFPELNTVITTLNLGTKMLDITYAQPMAMFSIILLTWLNSRGIQNGRIIQLVFTSAKLLALFALIILGLAIGLKSDTLAGNFQDMWNASKTTIEENVITVTPLAGFALLGAMGATIINSLFSSDAWNNVTFIAAEIKDPKKNIPRSLFLGTLIVTIIYILANLAYLSLLPIHDIQFAAHDRVGTAAASVILGDSATYLMAALIMVSTFGCNNGIILAGARLFNAMAKDGLFFSAASKLNSKQVPGKALWFQCLWACLLCLSGTYGDLLTYATFASLIFYIFTIYGIFILRKKEPDTPRPYKAFGYPVIPALYILITSAICIDLLVYDTRNAGLGLGIVLLGIPVYYIVQRNIEKKRQQTLSGL